MRLSSVLLVAAATATLLTSGKATAAASGRSPDISTMASPDAVVSLGTARGIEGEKRFLRYHNNNVLDKERESEERGFFDPSTLNALAREAADLDYTQLKGAGVERFFKTVAKNYNPYNVPIPDDYTKLRQLYRSWYYNHYVLKREALGLSL